VLLFDFFPRFAIKFRCHEGLTRSERLTPYHAFFPLSQFPLGKDGKVETFPPPIPSFAFPRPLPLRCSDFLLSPGGQAFLQDGFFPRFLSSFMNDARRLCGLFRNGNGHPVERSLKFISLSIPARSPPRTSPSREIRLLFGSNLSFFEKESCRSSV